MIDILTLFLLLLFIGGCAIKQEEIKEEKIEFDKLSFTQANLKKASWDSVENLDNADFKGSHETFKKDCKASGKRFETLKDICIVASSMDDSKAFFLTNFTPYKMYDNKGKDKGLMTGYYEASIKGSLQKSNRYKYPVYATPDDILTVDMTSVYPELKKYRLRARIDGKKIVPYYDRKAIESFPESKYKVLAYVEDDVELFFMQIQGSGKVLFEDGSHMNLGYSMQNGHKYSSIGRYMVEKGYLKQEEVSLDSIALWLHNNPDKKYEVMNTNRSYLFFQANKQGATGALGSELVAKKNIATDRRYIPLGFPVLISMKHPITKESIDDIVVSADVGGAINGEIRGDFFWGYGKDAKKAAGNTKEYFEAYLLVPNELIGK